MPRIIRGYDNAIHRVAKLKVEIEKFIKFHINRSGSFLEKSHLGGEFPSRDHSAFLE